MTTRYPSTRYPFWLCNIEVTYKGRDKMFLQRAHMRNRIHQLWSRPLIIVLLLRAALRTNVRAVLVALVCLG